MITTPTDLLTAIGFDFSLLPLASLGGMVGVQVTMETCLAVSIRIVNENTTTLLHYERDCNGNWAMDTHIEY